MPNPIEILLDPLSLTLIAIYLCLMAVEGLLPARTLPKVKGWIPRAMVSFVLYFYLATYLPMFWDAYLAPYQLIDLSGLNSYLAAFIGLLVFNSVLYFWHRSMHGSGLLWRAFHQMHHSAERIDSYGAFYFSPMDMIGFTMLGSIALVLIVGLPAEAVSTYLYASMFLVIFQHMNVNTPVWLGYIIQRPESHSVHHSKGIHAFNYADLPIFDILFGTFKNPKEFAAEAGFYPGASSRVLAMLAGRDVSEPHADKDCASPSHSH